MFFCFVCTSFTSKLFFPFHLIIACLHSIHGLIRGENMELGRDSDTGGQVQFILVFHIHLFQYVCG